MNEQITEEQIIDWLGHDWQFSQIVEINMIKDIKESE